MDNKKMVVANIVLAFYVIIVVMACLSSPIKIVNAEQTSTQIQEIKQEETTSVETIITETKTEEQTTTIRYTEHVVKENSFKSYMPYDLFATTSRQYQIQLDAYTNEFGLRMVNGKYCVAIGTGYGADVGTVIEVVMKNGYSYLCIVGDIKADIHTDATNKYALDGSVLEFIVDMDLLDEKVKHSGNISNAHEMFEGEIESIRIYPYRN